MQISEKYFMLLNPQFARALSLDKAPVASLHHCNYQLSGSKCSVLLVLGSAGSCKPVESSRSGEAETTPTLMKGELYEQLL
jgi:hypothetical protein